MARNLFVVYFSAYKTIINLFLEKMQITKLQN